MNIIHKANITLGIALIICMAIILIKTLLFTSGINDEFKAKIKELEKQVATIPILEDEIKQCMKFDLFMQAVEEIGEIPYDRASANCYDHAKILQDKLLEMEIESTIAVNPNRDHAWLMVWIETVDGNFSVRGNQSIMEIRDNNLNVICSNET